MVHAYVVFKNQLFVGLKVASKLFPLGLITGTVPVDINPANKGKPIEPASKQMFTREDVFSLLEQTEVSESDKNSSSKFFEIFTIIDCKPIKFYSKLPRIQYALNLHGARSQTTRIVDIVMSICENTKMMQSRMLKY